MTPDPDTKGESTRLDIILANEPNRSFAGQLSLGVLLATIIWSWYGTGFSVFELVSNSQNIWVFLADFFPPDFSRLGYFLREMLTTIEIAVMGTFLSVLFAAPLSLLCSDNLIAPAIRLPVRRVMDGLRAINELVLAMIFVVAVGLGVRPRKINIEKSPT